MKKILSLVLCFVMCLSMLTVGVFANETETQKAPVVFDINSTATGSTNTTITVNDGGWFDLEYKDGGSARISAIFEADDSFSGADYKYMAIKYRYAAANDKAQLSLYREGIRGNDPQNENYEYVVSSRSQDGQIRTVADGEWQTAIIDMTSISFEGQRYTKTDGTKSTLVAAEKSWGNYDYKKLSILAYGWNAPEDASFDLEYMAFFATADEANKYVSGATGIVIDDLSDMNKASSDTEVTYNDEGFLRFNYKSGGTCGWLGAKFQARVNFEGSAYKYMAIKYRYDKEYAEAGISIYRYDITGIDANNDNATYTVSSRSADGQIATIDDGEWQTAIIDMTSISFEGQRYTKADGTKSGLVAAGKSWGNYTYSMIAVLPFGWSRPEGAQFDLEYVGFFKTEEEAKTYAGIPMYEDTATGYTYDAARLDLVYKMNTSYSINASIKSSDDGSYATFTTDQTSGAKAGRLYIPLGEGFDVTTQKYFAIKYRYNDNKLLADMQLMRSIKSDASNPLSRVKDGSFTTITDGDGWQTIVIDLTTVEWDNDLFIGKTWSEYSLDGIYLMPWGGAATNGATVDIAVLGFSDTENNARAIVGLEPVVENTPSDNNPTDNPADSGNDTEDTTNSADTTNTTESADATDTEATVEEKKGCGSSLNYAGIVLVMVIGAISLMIFKKKEYNC